LELWFRSYDILNETPHILSKYSLACALTALKCDNGKLCMTPESA